MNWLEVRKALTKLRTARHWNKSTLARVASLNRATVDRVEDVKGDPSYTPDIATVGKWLTAVEYPEPVTRFLDPFDKMTSPVQVASDTMPSDTPPQQWRQPDHGTGVAEARSSPPAPDDPAFADLLERIGFALVGAARTVRADAALRRVDLEKSDGRRGRAEAGEPDPAHLSRVK